MINQTVMELILVLMALFIQECGLMTCSMVKDKHHGLMDLPLLEITKRVRRMELVVTFGRKEINIRVSGKTT
jgi:hypothetical protein